MGKATLVGSRDRSAAAAAFVSAGRAAEAARVASVRSMRSSMRTATPSPTTMRPPMAATAPGVTVAGSNARSCIDTPEATRATPPALMTAPNTSKTTYIRTSPARKGIRRPHTAVFWPPSHDRARIIAIGPPCAVLRPRTSAATPDHPNALRYMRNQPAANVPERLLATPPRRP